MKNVLSISLAALAATSLLISGSALAYEAGDWRVTGGMTNIDPEQDNGSVVEGLDLDVVVDEDTQFTFTGAYMITPEWAVELLASLPFEHNFTVGGLDGGSTKHLPPTLSLQYHFNSAGKLIPYLGLGVNYTIFFDERTTGALEDTLIDLAGTSDVTLDNSVGVALQAGVDYMIDDNFFVNLDLRYISIEPDAELNGDKIGTVDINPTLVGLSLGYRF